MFAGPNGSGKSELKKYLPLPLLGVYLNPDELEKEIRRQSYLDLSAYNVTANAAEILVFFRDSSFLKSAGLTDEIDRLSFDGSRLVFGNVEPNSYFASVAIDFVRQKLLDEKISFTCETVMSHPSKVALLE